MLRANSRSLPNSSRPRQLPDAPCEFRFRLVCSSDRREGRRSEGLFR